MSFDENSIERALVEDLNNERSIHIGGKKMKNDRKSYNKQRGHTTVRPSKHKQD